MNQSPTEVLSTLLDGEPVVPDDVATALEDADARRALVDFVRVREAARRNDGPVPASLDGLHHRSLWRRAVPLPAVAALVLIVFLVSWFVPRQPLVDRPSQPPAPARTLTFEPGVDWQQGLP